VAIDHQEGLFEVQTKTVEALTGETPQNLSDFVREHEALFTGKEVFSLGI
jgi:hypothetical protein